jgi:hypothetical protein
MRIVVLITIIFLLGTTYLPKLSEQAQNTLPDPINTVQYVENLIDSYNSLVAFSDVYKSNFQSIEADFSLYHQTGESFAVIVMQSVPDNSDFVALIFFPIKSETPVVIMDNSDTLASVYGFYITGEDNIFENLLMSYTNTIVHLDLILEIQVSDITNDTLVNSKNTAQFIYNNDESQISQSTISTTTAHQTITITQPQVISSITTLTITKISTTTATKTTTAANETEIVVTQGKLSTSDWINLVASVVSLVIVFGTIIGVYRSKRLRNKASSWLGGN